MKKELKNAGAHRIDDAVVTDRKLISLRNPGDLQQINAEIEELLHKSNEVDIDRNKSIKDNSFLSNQEI